jgi:hypothetical protein
VQNDQTATRSASIDRPDLPAQKRKGFAERLTPFSQSTPGHLVAMGWSAHTRVTGGFLHLKHHRAYRSWLLNDEGRLAAYPLGEGESERPDDREFQERAQLLDDAFKLNLARLKSFTVQHIENKVGCFEFIVTAGGILLCQIQPSAEYTGKSLPMKGIEVLAATSWESLSNHARLTFSKEISGLAKAICDPGLPADLIY